MSALLKLAIPGLAIITIVMTYRITFTITKVTVAIIEKRAEFALLLRYYSKLINGCISLIQARVARTGFRFRTVKFPSNLITINMLINIITTSCVITFKTLNGLLGLLL